MARGQGVTRIRGTGPGAPLPEGREPGDARGATWPILLLAAGVIVGLMAAAVILGSALLYREGISIGPWIRDISPYVLGLIGAAFALLLTKILNNDGRGLRNQQTLAANQDAVHRLLKNTADGLIGLGERVDRIDQRLDARSDAALAAELTAATRAMQELSEQTSARIGRAVATITGQQRAVPTRGTPPAPDPPEPGVSPRVSDPLEQDPFDTSRPWRTGATDTQPAVPEPPPRPPKYLRDR